MADDGGFQLNISTSGGAPRAQPKKKKPGFHAKKNAKRNKVKVQAPASSGSDKPIHVRPQATQQQKPHAGAARAARPTVSEAVKKPGIVRFDRPAAKKPAASKEADDAIAENAEIDPAVDSTINDDAEVDAVPEASAQIPAPEDTKEEPVVAAAAEEKKSAFGTRRNPNKEGYAPEQFMTVKATIDHVLDKPLESTSSEKIFAHSTFESMQLHPRIIDILKKDHGSGGFGFARPTTVQVNTIPMVLSGRDVLVKSETGSGKTLSYLLPIVQKLQSIEPRVGRQDGCLALILAPTRELCQQIQETADKLTKAFIFLVPGSVVGGEKKKTEKARLRKGICILIATPGRLADHLVNTQSFNYSRLQFLVLDEADRLLDMGFQKQITQILEIIDVSTKNNKYTGGRRQNLLVSATINSGVQELAKMSLRNPVLIDADKEMAKRDRAEKQAQPAGQVETFNTPHQLQQHFMIAPAKLRLCALASFLRQELTDTSGADKVAKKCKIVVFMSTCDAVDFHFSLFQKCTWPGGAKSTATGSDEKKDRAGAASPLFGAMGPLFRLHGNIPQQERMSTFKNFCSSSSGVLVCTDVAARGLNLPTVQWIVQYDPPTETRDYVHRVGRTARSGNEGSSLLFLLPSESEYLDYLKKHNLTLNALSLEKTIARVAAAGGFGLSRKKLVHEVVQSDLQYLFEQTLLADAKLFELACQGFHSFVRSYATHSSDTRGIFHVRGLHFGHIAKSFALREPPASTKLRDAGKNAKVGTLQKRKDRDDKEKNIYDKKVKQQRQQHRKFAQHVSEFAD